MTPAHVCPPCRLDEHAQCEAAAGDVTVPGEAAVVVPLRCACRSCTVARARLSQTATPATPDAGVAPV